MSRRRKNGKLARLKRDERAHRKPGELMVARSMKSVLITGGEKDAGRARYYRHAGYLVVWQAGKFKLEVTDPVALKGYAKPPAGLRKRINESLKAGKRNG